MPVNMQAVLSTSQHPAPSTAPAPRASSPGPAANSTADELPAVDNGRAVDHIGPDDDVQPPPRTLLYQTCNAPGHGAYSTILKAVHLATGQLYACKIISKRSADARILARWEVSLLKRLAGAHRNIITLHELLQSSDNFYLILDFCAGGELYTRVCESGSYDESRASGLLRTILGAVHFLHTQDIVHRALTPENILFRMPHDDAEVVIANFDLSCIIKGTERRFIIPCRTVGYMAPEVFHKVGYGKPVDVWAVGAIAYFVLSGQSPFDRDTEKEKVAAIVAGDYAVQPLRSNKISEFGQDFVRALMTIEHSARPTVAQALEHSWLTVSDWEPSAPRLRPVEQV